MCKNFIVAVIYMSASKWLLLITDVECHFHVIRSNILQYYWPRRNTQSYDVKYACAIAIEGLDIRFEETISNEDCLQGSSTINFKCVTWSTRGGLLCALQHPAHFTTTEILLMIMSKIESIRPPCSFIPFEIWKKWIRIIRPPCHFHHS